jgi:hypothetical protein
MEIFSKKRGLSHFGVSAHESVFQKLVESRNSSGHNKVHQMAAARPPPEAVLVEACRGSSSRRGHPIQKGADSIGFSS